MVRFWGRCQRTPSSLYKVRLVQIESLEGFFAHATFPMQEFTKKGVTGFNALLEDNPGRCIKSENIR